MLWPSSQPSHCSVVLLQGALTSALRQAYQHLCVYSTDIHKHPPRATDGLCPPEAQSDGEATVQHAQCCEEVHRGLWECKGCLPAPGSGKASQRRAGVVLGEKGAWRAEERQARGAPAQGRMRDLHSGLGEGRNCSCIDPHQALYGISFNPHNSSDRSCNGQVLLCFY